ncbi:hypothetical protein LJ737_05120 [Hymenobacter sp. 15J16-1T3B]|uniref:hypothetical protein n=1 Tax=Hymenobacter sp. 15J16-1T3B TaxID=2886941 RepID=UPI001D106EF9|nr:hypothetical protein [Hymenobacter sp. 15J16-1T3B]MCC3156608.1 hypothetical protein [Hymenobacter sp. 15J16-1T3B]
MRLYFENRAGRISDDPAGFARLTYHPGQRSEDELRALLGHVTRLLARRADGRLLVDQRLMQPFSASEQQHVMHQWMPAAVADGGYRFGAVVQAHDVFARLATASVTTQGRDLNLTYRYFDDEAPAVEWLLMQLQ